MFRWLKQRLMSWAEHVQQQRLESLHRENVRLKAEVLKQSGGKPIRLTPEQRYGLIEAAKGIDPKTLNRISVLDSEEPESTDADDTSAASA